MIGECYKITISDTLVKFYRIKKYFPDSNTYIAEYIYVSNGNVNKHLVHQNTTYLKHEQLMGDNIERINEAYFKIAKDVVIEALQVINKLP